jgi:predicted small lipoprotein YifL
MRIHFVGLCVRALLLTSLAGCGGGVANKGPSLVPVEGTITMDGKPLAEASLMFGTGSAMGETDASGHYELKAQGGKKGCPAGEFKVVVEKWLNADGSVYRSAEMSPMDAGAKQQIPPKYSNAEKTELKASVKEGGAKINFELKSGG